MVQIIGERSSGKTKELLFEVARTGGLLVCQDPIHMREKGYVLGLVGLNIMSYKDFIEHIQDHPLEYAPQYSHKGFKDERYKEIYVDELEGLMQHICLNRLSGYTLSKEKN